MSFERPWRWTCDVEECGRVVEVRGYGLPRGWFFVPAGFGDGGQSFTCGPGPRGKAPRDSYASDEPVEVIPPIGETGGRVPPCRSTDDAR